MITVKKTNRAMTDDERREIVAKLRSGKLPGVVAKEHNRKLSSLYYHLGGGKATSAFGRPWAKRISRARALVVAGCPQDAIEELRLAIIEIQNAFL